MLKTSIKKGIGLFLNLVVLQRICESFWLFLSCLLCCSNLVGGNKEQVRLLLLRVWANWIQWVHLLPSSVSKLQTLILWTTNENNKNSLWDPMEMPLLLNMHNLYLYACEIFKIWVVSSTGLLLTFWHCRVTH